MKKTILLLLTGLGLSTQAQSWKVLPVLDADYSPNFAVAVTAGAQELKSSDDYSGVYGLEVSLNCPLLTPPEHTIRQQLSIENYEYDNILITSFELSPHHMFELSSTMTVGIGPSVGVSHVEVNDIDDTLFTYGAGASIRKDITSDFFIGAQTQYIWMSDTDFGNKDVDLNSFKLIIKSGFQF